MKIKQAFQQLLQCAVLGCLSLNAWAETKTIVIKSLIPDIKPGVQIRQAYGKPGQGLTVEHFDGEETCTLRYPQSTTSFRISFEKLKCRLGLKSDAEDYWPLHVLIPEAEPIFCFDTGKLEPAKAISLQRGEKNVDNWQTLTIKLVDTKTQASVEDDWSAAKKYFSWPAQALPLLAQHTYEIHLDAQVFSVQMLQVPNDLSLEERLKWRAEQGCRGGETVVYF